MPASCLPGGSCPTVGVAGLTLGGGVGVFARRYGLAADSVASMHGRHRRRRRAPLLAEPGAGPLLGVPGGGGGNFGVVTSFEFTTHPMPPVTLFTYDFDWAAAHDVLGAWQHWTRTVNPAVWSNCQLLAGAGSTDRARRGRRVRLERPDRGLARATACPRAADRTRSSGPSPTSAR